MDGFISYKQHRTSLHHFPLMYVKWAILCSCVWTQQLQKVYDISTFVNVVIFLGTVVRFNCVTTCKTLLVGWSFCQPIGYIIFSICLLLVGAIPVYVSSICFCIIFLLIFIYETYKCFWSTAIIRILSLVRCCMKSFHSFIIILYSFTQSEL